MTQPICQDCFDKILQRMNEKIAEQKDMQKEYAEQLLLVDRELVQRQKYQESQEFAALQEEEKALDLEL